MLITVTLTAYRKRKYFCLSHWSSLYSWEKKELWYYLFINSRTCIIIILCFYQLNWLDIIVLNEFLSASVLMFQVSEWCFSILVWVWVLRRSVPRLWCRVCRHPGRSHSTTSLISAHWLRRSCATPSRVNACPAEWVRPIQTAPATVLRNPPSCCEWRER